MRRLARAEESLSLDLSQQRLQSIDFFQAIDFEDRLYAPTDCLPHALCSYGLPSVCPVLLRIAYHRLLCITNYGLDLMRRLARAEESLSLDLSQQRLTSIEFFQAQSHNLFQAQSDSLASTSVPEREKERERE